MVKSEKVVADFNDHVNASGVLGDSPDPKEVRDALKVLMGQKFKERLQSDYPLPTAAAIKFNPSIPMLEAAGGGTLHDLKKARKACIAIYKCIKCSALYVLPEDFKAAGRALDYPVGAGGMTPEAIRKLCVRAMQNAYQGLGMEKAEVYCFKNFVVMIDLMLEIEYDYKGNLPHTPPLPYSAEEKQW